MDYRTQSAPLHLNRCRRRRPSPPQPSSSCPSSLPTPLPSWPVSEHVSSALQPTRVEGGERNQHTRSRTSSSSLRILARFSSLTAASTLRFSSAGSGARRLVSVVVVRPFVFLRRRGSLGDAEAWVPFERSRFSAAEAAESVEAVIMRFRWEP